MTKDMAERIKDGKVVMKSKDPEIQAALNKKVDELTGTKPATGKPTKIETVTTEKGVPIIRDARGNVNKELTKMAEDLLSGKPKKATGTKTVLSPMTQLRNKKSIKPKKATGTKPAPTKVPKNKSTVKPGPTKVPKIKAKPKKLAGGGIAIKGQGKAFLKSKR
tara:strand:- start:3877 stop:4365 length:489 start_codon:yes stop_codon:yes gene_type:complete